MLFSLHDRDVIASDWHNVANFNNFLMLIAIASASMDGQENVTSAILSFNLYYLSLSVLSFSTCDGDVIASDWHQASVLSHVDTHRINNDKRATLATIVTLYCALRWCSF